MVIITYTKGLVARYFDLSCIPNKGVLIRWSRTRKESDVGIFGAVYLTKDNSSNVSFSDDSGLIAGEEETISLC